MFAKTGNVNLDTKKVAKVLRNIEVGKRGPRRHEQSSVCCNWKPWEQNSLNVCYNQQPY